MLVLRRILNSIFPFRESTHDIILRSISSHNDFAIVDFVYCIKLDGIFHIYMIIEEPELIEKSQCTQIEHSLSHQLGFPVYVAVRSDIDNEVQIIGDKERFRLLYDRNS